MREYPLNTQHVRYKGVFDFEGLYELVYDWLHKRKYRTQEDKYKNKPDSPWGYEHEVKILARKKIDEFYKYKLTVVIHVRDGAEVVHKDKELMHGRVRVVISGKIITDYAKRFEKNAFTKFIENIYNDFLIKREIELLNLDELHYRLHEFQQKIKKHLNMYADVNYYRGG